MRSSSASAGTNPARSSCRRAAGFLAAQPPEVTSSVSLTAIGRTLRGSEPCAHGALELRDRHRPLETRLDPPVAADDEHPGLAREVPLADPAVLALRRVVVLVDLDVDVPAGDALLHRTDDVDRRPTGPRLAELRGRERDDERDV